MLFNSPMSKNTCLKSEENTLNFPRGKRKACSSYSQFRELIKKQYTDELEFNMKLEEVSSKFERASGKRLGSIFENDPWSALLSWEEISKIQGNGFHLAAIRWIIIELVIWMKINFGTNLPIQRA